MAALLLLKNALLVNEGHITHTDILLNGQRIEKIAASISVGHNTTIIDCEGDYVLPGVIDDQVHFREPGLTHKGTIASESRAAVLGGTTSFMEMPNTIPAATTAQELEKKYSIAACSSPANYSFFVGATNQNAAELARIDFTQVCGIKAFLGSSTGDLLVDNETSIEQIFSLGQLVATHCEDEATIRHNMQVVKEQGESDPSIHPFVRSREACYLSSSKAVALAKKLSTRLHVLHITTADEIALFEPGPVESKRITAEVCVHHLHFSAEDYARLGNQIKCNPAIKNPADREALWLALLENQIDIIATDHAPHTWAEKAQDYWAAPAGLPLVQHGLALMLSKWQQGKISLPQLVHKMAHAPALCFGVQERGFVREGYFADLVRVKQQPWQVDKANIAYQCGWSPFEGMTFNYKVADVFVSGNQVVKDGRLVETGISGMRMTFAAR